MTTVTLRRPRRKKKASANRAAAIDLGRVRMARHALDVLVVKHPELRSVEARERLALRLDAEREERDGGSDGGKTKDR